jgi:hypothetical protein
MTTPRRKLSKSACSKYQQCPAGYDYHYNKYIRAIKTSSPLVFGNGIDHGLNIILLNTGGDAMLAFDLEYMKHPLGSIVPNQNDYDGELIEHKDGLLEQVRDFGYTGDDVDGLASTLLAKAKSGEELSENQSKAIDLLCRASLRAKAVLMFEAYRLKVLPFITKVVNVQKASGPGFLDATVEWEGTPVVMDHKTSGKPYPLDACDYSLELALYAQEEKIYQVVYVVLLKPIKKNRIKICATCGFKGLGTHTKCNNEVAGKRCNGEWNVTILPEAEIQIVHGEITPRAMEVAGEVQASIRKAVDNEIFHCNFKDCNSQFGKQCEYKNLKWKGDMTGFEIKPKVKK